MSCGGHDGDLNLICKTFHASAVCALLGLAPLSMTHGAERLLDLDPETVTEKPVGQQAATLTATTVLDRESIERSQARSLPGLLRPVPGLSMAGGAYKDGYGTYDTTIGSAGVTAAVRVVRPGAWSVQGDCA